MYICEPPMRLETSEWIREARVAIESAHREFTACSSFTAPACENLFTGVEKAAKTLVYEQYGHIPRSFHHHKLTTLCQSAGLWGLLPTNLQSFVLSMARFGPQTRYPSTPEYRLLLASTGIDWARGIQEARELVDIVDNHVTAISSSAPKLAPG
jgi:hypothetical protein